MFWFIIGVFSAFIAGVQFGYQNYIHMLVAIIASIICFSFMDE